MSVDERSSDSIPRFRISNDHPSQGDFSLKQDSGIPSMSQTSSSTFEEFIKRVAPENVMHFQNGLPGFPSDKRFVLVQNPEERPLVWLQSLDSPSLLFVATSPFTLFPDYRPNVPDHELAALGSPAPEETLVLCILRVIPLSTPELHANLKAPVIINLRTLAARQVIITNESMYSERAVYRVGSGK